MFMNGINVEKSFLLYNNLLAYRVSCVIKNVFLRLFYCINRKSKYLDNLL